MPFSPTNATCRCFSYWFLTFLLSTRSMMLLHSLCFSPEVGLSSLMHAHLVIGCSCWLAISSPLPITLRNAVRSLTISIVPRMHIVFRSATFNSCNLQQFAARYQLGLRESQLILTVRYAKNVKNKLNFNPSIILNFKKLTRP